MQHDICNSPVQTKFREQYFWGEFFVNVFPDPLKSVPMQFRHVCFGFDRNRSVLIYRLPSRQRMFVRWLIAPKREIMRCLNFDLIAFSGTAEKQIAAIKLPVVFSAAGSKMSLGFGSKNQAPWAVLLVLTLNGQSSTKVSTLVTKKLWVQAVSVKRVSVSWG